MKILSSDKLKLLDAHFNGDYKLFLFPPRIFHLFPASGNMHNMSFKQKVRFAVLLIHGYRVYVMGDQSDNVVGCAVFANGKAYRYPFADENDLICGPYYVMPEFRRRGIATKLLTGVIERYETDYNTIYAHIWHENRASVDCMGKIGFVPVDTLSTTRILQKCYSDANGKLILVKRDNPAGKKE